MSSSRSRPVRIALSGFGHLAAQVHGPLLRRMNNVELIGIADPLEERRRLACGLVSAVQIFASQTEMLAKVDCDAILISASPGVHAALAEEALRNGKHIYLEKPPCSNLAEAVSVTNFWRSTELVALVGFNFRFHPSVLEMRRLLREGRVGRMRVVRSVFSGAATPSMPAWRKSRREGGGALLELGSHHIDLFHFICGAEVASVSARIWTETSDNDCALVDLISEDGLTLQSFFSLSSTEEDVIEIYGTGGKIKIDRYHLEAAQFFSVSHQQARWQGVLGQLGSCLPRPRVVRKLFAPWHEPSYAVSWRRFVAAVQGGSTEGCATLEDGLRCMTVLDAAERSAREGRPVSSAAVTAS